jgi:hypothetical protein
LLPIPVLAIDGAQDGTGSDGTQFTRYDLTVVNWADYPAELFEPSPDLDPCGLSANSSRTWVDIVDSDTGERIYGFCGLAQPEDLALIWFAVPEGTAPPTRVIVSLWDRRDGKLGESNIVEIPR